MRRYPKDCGRRIRLSPAGADAVFESEWMRRPLAEIFGPKPNAADAEG